MYQFLLICLLVSLSSQSIHARTYLDETEFGDAYNVDQTEQQARLPEKSYLEKLEEKTIYDNEIRKLENLFANEKEVKDHQDDDYLRSSKVYPAFNFKELNNQQIKNDEDLDVPSDARSISDQIEIANEMNQIRNHYLTTMPTDLRNQLITGPRLRRAWKKRPFRLDLPPKFDYQNSEIYNEQVNGGDFNINPPQAQSNLNQAVDNEKLAEVEENLNKEIDLEELTKYLMAKRAHNGNENDDKKSDSSSSSKSSSSKDSEKDSKEDNSKESKESKDSSKESDEANEKNKEDLLVPGNYTELKKTIITERDGKAIKVETLKKSVELSEKAPVQDDYRTMLEDQSNLLLINQPSDANYERILHQVNLDNPIRISQRDSLDRYEPNSFLQKSRFFRFNDLYFIGIVVGLSMASIMSVIGGGYCFYRYQQHNKATADIDYPAYGVIGPAFSSSQDDDTSPKSKKSPLAQESLVSKATSINHQSILSQNANQTNSDRKLAQSAQMYHYHHQKQQMISTEKNKNGRNASASDVESEEENEEGDYTVYECPGLSNLGEIEITNPNFQHENVDTPTTESKKGEN